MCPHTLLLHSFFSLPKLPQRRFFSSFPILNALYQDQNAFQYTLKGPQLPLTYIIIKVLKEENHSIVGWSDDENKAGSILFEAEYPADLSNAENTLAEYGN